MELFSRKAGNKRININGKLIQFKNGVATVEDDFGAEILKLGLPDLYEKGKEPAFQTPKEVQLKSDFKDKEEWYQKELARVTNVSEARQRKINELEAEVRVWKEEYQKEHDLRIKEASNRSNQPEPEHVNSQQAKDGVEDQKPTENPVKDDEVPSEEEQLRKELSSMTKKQLLEFGAEAEIDMEPVKSEKSVQKIIDFIVEKSKE